MSKQTPLQIDIRGWYRKMPGRLAILIDNEAFRSYQSNAGMILQKGDLHGEPVGRRKIVVILQCEEIAASFCERSVLGLCDSSIAFALDEPESRLGKRAYHLHRVVRRAIIHDDQFKVTQRLVNQTCKGLTDETRPVIGADDNRHSGNH